MTKLMEIVLWVIVSLEAVASVIFMIIGSAAAIAGCDRTHADSPQGDVPLEAVAYSPDGNYYAKQTTGTTLGDVAVFQVSDSKQIWQWDPLGYPLKGMAWSSDSKRVALMYHFWSYPDEAHCLIKVFELYKSEMVAKGEILGDFYHEMRYAEDGKGVYLSDICQTPYVPLIEITGSEGEGEGEGEGES